MTPDSYLSVRAKATVVAQDLLRVVAEKMEQAEEELALEAVSYTGGKAGRLTSCEVGRRSIPLSRANQHSEGGHISFSSPCC